MKRLTRIGLSAVLIVLGMAAVIGVIAAASATADLAATDTTGQVDLTLEMMAPKHAAAGSTYVVRIGYYNLGTELAPDAQVTATIPTMTRFVTATDRWGTPLPPFATEGNNLAWHLDRLSCSVPADANCGHILLTLQTDENALEGELLTTTATIATTAVESDTTNNTASTVSVVCDMAGSTKQVQAWQVMPGDVLTYTLEISRMHRHGEEMNERWVVLTDTLPFSHQTRFLGWHGILTGTQIDGHVLRWQGRVRAGDPLTLQYRLGVEGAVTPGTIITNVAHLAWQGHRMRLGPVTTVVTLPHGALAVGPNQSGQLHHSYGVTLTVPPGAVTDTTRLQIGPLFTATKPISPPGGLLFANRAFEVNAYRFGEPVGQFNAPLTITVSHTDTDVAGLKRETLRVWTRSGPEGPWNPLSEPARWMSGTLSFTTTHLSQFAVFGEAKHRLYLPLVNGKDSIRQ